MFLLKDGILRMKLAYRSAFPWQISPLFPFIRDCKYSVPVSWWGRTILALLCPPSLHHGHGTWRQPDLNRGWKHSYFSWLNANCAGVHCVYLQRQLKGSSKVVQYSFINVLDSHDICEQVWKRIFLLCTLIIVCIFLKSITLGFTLHSGELFRLNPSGSVQLISFADRLNVQSFSDSPYLFRRQSPHSRQSFDRAGLLPTAE